MPVDGLPVELDGLRILHLADLHLGSLSLNARALRIALDWAATQQIDLAAVTGDLLARPRGEALLRRLLGRLQARHGTYAVLGNVDIAVTRDPFSAGADLTTLAPQAVLLRDETVSLTISGRRVQLVGCAPERRADPPVWLADPAADLRVLLAHFPDTVDHLPAGAFDLILSGHTHDGQICIPYPGGKLRCAGPREPYPVGRYRSDRGTLVVSRGVGTTFVPFRFLARPEASVLVLRAGASTVH